MIRVLGLVGAAAVLTLARPLAAQESSRPSERWTDGMFEYEAIAPTAGYFVPFAALANDRPPLGQLIDQATRMSVEDLRAYATGTGGLKVTKDLLLFTYELAGPTVFLWKGKRSSGQQQILPMVWTGQEWTGLGSLSGNVDSVEILVGPERGPRRAEHVLVMTQSGLAPNTLQTEFVRAGPFPGVEAILRAGIERADAVVYLPHKLDQIAGHALDCLKGSMTAAALRPLVLAQWEYQALLFLERDGAAHRLWFAYCSGRFHNHLGDLHVEEYARGSPFIEHARWALAGGFSEATSRPTATLTWSNRGRTEDGWMRVELAVGREEPASLYRIPITRSGRDGGQPVFEIRIRRGEHRATLVPRGRTGADSFAAAEPEQLPDLDCEYRFVNCGIGVIKIEIRAKERPWTAELQASYGDPNPLNKSTPAVTTAVVQLADA